MVKINDKFTYPDELDLTKYLHPQNKNLNSMSPPKYTLHSIVVHQGTATSGHYFAYIKCTTDNNNWILFNDEIVKPAEKHDVFENSFGGMSKLYKHKGKGEIIESNYINETSAYILVYIKNSSRSEILNPMTEYDVRLF